MCFVVLRQETIINNYFTEMCSGSEEGSCLRLIDFSLSTGRVPRDTAGSALLVVYTGVCDQEQGGDRMSIPLCVTQVMRDL